MVQSIGEKGKEWLFDSVTAALSRPETPKQSRTKKRRHSVIEDNSTDLDSQATNPAPLPLSVLDTFSQ